MRVVVALEARFSLTPDGAVWTSHTFERLFWKRYLEAFDSVAVLARVRPTSRPGDHEKRADGPGIKFISIPYYLGPVQYSLKWLSVRRAVRKAIGPEDVVIMRVPSQVGNDLFPVLQAQQRPFGVEVVGDPWDVFARGVVDHPLRPLLRRYLSCQLKQQCAHACAAAYVTKWMLQKRYPTGANAITVAVSDVELHSATEDGLPGFVPTSHSRAELSGASCLSRPRGTTRRGDYRLVLVGSLEQLYKGVDMALAAVGICARKGLDLHLDVLGDGRFRPKLEALAVSIGVRKRVTFHGSVPREVLFQFLDKADLFVMPSKTEGLPRAMIEAMAKGLPCIASAVGGIPELLPDEDMVPPGDAEALAVKIQAVLSDPGRRANMSRRNLVTSKEYAPDVLEARRSSFYRHVRACTEEWIKTRDESLTRC